MSDRVTRCSKCEREIPKGQVALGPPPLDWLRCACPFCGSMSLQREGPVIRIVVTYKAHVWGKAE